MKEPKEKDENVRPGNKKISEEEASTNQIEIDKNLNWDKHKQVDEEGNEVGPDDIKILMILSSQFDGK